MSTRRTTSSRCSTAKFSRRQKASLYAALAAAALSTGIAKADVVTWTAGSGSDFNWYTSSNWDNGLPSLAGDVFFPAAYANPATLLNPDVVTLQAGSVANSLTFLNKYRLTGGDLQLGSGRVSVVHGMSSIIDSKLTGTAGFTKLGNGSLYLTNAANDYTGTTTISEGAVYITAQHALGSDSSAVLVYGSTTRGVGGGALVLGSANNNTAGNTFTRDLTVTGGGVSGDQYGFSSVGNNTFSGHITGSTLPAGLNPTGGTTLTSSSTRLSSSGGVATISGGFTAQTSGIFTTLMGNGHWVVNSNIDGAGGLEKGGSGLLVLNSGITNTMLGNLQMSGGFTRVSTLAAFGAATGTSSVSINGGTLEVRADGGLVTGKNVGTNSNGTIFVDHGVAGSGVNGTTSFKDLILNNRALTYNGRNGYNLTFLDGNNNANSITDTASVTANGNGLLTLTGDLNPNNASSRTFTLAGNGEILVTGSVKGTGAVTHSVTKSGTGILTVQGTASTYTGNTNITGGTLRINSFGAINATAGTLNLGNATTTTGALDYRGTGETVTKTINLDTTTAAGVILANQTGATPNPLILNGTVNATTGSKTLYLGGSSSVDNEIQSALPTAGGTLSVAKVGPGTWVLSNGSNAQTGGVTIAEGTLKVKASGATSTVLADGGNITFNTNGLAGNQTAGGTLEFVASTAATEIVGAVTPTAGAGNVKITPTAGSLATLQFGSGATNGIGSFGGSGAVNFSAPASAVNGTDYKFVLNNQAAGFVNGRTYFNGADWGYYDTTAGYLRAPVYGTDTGFLLNTLTASNHVKLTNSMTTGSSLSLKTIKLDGDVTLTIGSGFSLTTNNASTSSSAGLLAVNGSSKITGGTVLSTGGSANLSVRVEGANSKLTIETPLSNVTTGGITKTGAGTLVLAGANSQTGTTAVNEGTLQLSGSGRLGAAGAAATNTLEVRQGATFDLNGINAGAGAFNGAGTITNSGAAAAIFAIGNGVTTNGGAGVFSGMIQDGASPLAVSVTTANNTAGQTTTFSLIGANTYTGATTIGKTTAGALILAANKLADIGQASSIGRGDVSNNAGSLVFNGGILQYTGANAIFQQAEQTPSVSINRLFTLAGNGTLDSSGQYGNSVLSGGSANHATLIFNNTSAIAFSGAGDRVLTLQGNSTGDNEFRPLLGDNTAGSGVLGLTKSGSGFWILNNANSYTGATTLAGGTLRAEGPALPANSPIFFNGGVLQTQGAFTRPLAATAVNGASTVSWAAAGNGGFAASTSKLTVNLGGNATPDALTWGTTAGFLGTGTLILGSVTSLADTELVNPIELGGAARTVQVDTNNTTTGEQSILSGVISGPAASSLTKTGSGTLRLTADNTYAGDTLLTAGITRVNTIGNSSSTASNLGAGSGKVSITATGGTTTLAYVGSGETSDRTVELAGTTNSIILDASGTGALVLTKVTNAATGTGARTLFLRGDSTAANEITSTLTNNPATGVLNLQKDEPGLWILSGQNTYSGTTALNSGILGLGADSTGTTSGPLGSTGRLTITNAALQAFNGARTISNPVTLAANATTAFVGANSITLNGSLLTSTGGNTTITNSLGAGATLTINAATFTGQESTSARTIVFNGSGASVLNSSVTNTSGGANIGLQYSGYGSLTLGGQSTYAGSTTLSSGTLKLAIDEAIPSGTGKGNMTINPAAGLSATFDLNGHVQTVNGLTANSGNITIDNTSSSPATFTFGANDVAATIVGSIINTGSGALSITKAGTAAATLSGGPFSYKGATTVNGGTMTIASDVTATNAISVNGTGAVLTFSGGLSAAPNVTSVSVGSGSQLNLFDGAGTPMNNVSTLNLGAGSILSLNTGATSDTITANGFVNVGGLVTFNIRDTGSMAGTSTYDLLVALGGGLINGNGISNGSYALNQIPGGFTTLTLNQTDTKVSLVTGTLVTSSIYWNNATADGKWNTVDASFKGLNFSKDKAGTIVSDFIPGAGTTVVFQADSLTGGGAVTTTLEQGFRINALEFEGSTTATNTPASVTIAPGALATNKLTIDPGNTSSADGINLKAGGPTAVTISAMLGLGSDQTWTTASGNTLTVSGPLAGAGALAKAGLGKVSLTGTADGTFAGTTVSVNGGALELTNVAALGSAVAGNLAPVSINNGGAFYYNNATSGTLANAVTLNGGTLAAAGNSQTYSGNINLAADSTVSTRDAGVTTATTRTVTLSGVLSGAGKMIVNGNPTLSGGTALSGTVILT